MRKIILLALLFGLIAGPGWCADVVTIPGYYKAGNHDNCDDASGWTAGTIDTAQGVAGASSTIWMCDGTYAYTDISANGQTFPLEGQTYRGEGRDTTILDLDGCAGLGFRILSDDVTLRDFWIRNAGSLENISTNGYTPDGLEIYNVRSSGAGEEGMNLTGAANAHVHYCYIHDNGRAGVLASGAGVEIDHNTIEDNGTSGAYNYDGIGSSGTGMSIHHNTVTGQKSDSGSGIDPCHGDGSIYSNIILNCEGPGLNHCGPGPNVFYLNFVSGNFYGAQIYGNDDAGGTGSATFRNNHFLANTNTTSNIRWGVGAVTNDQALTWVNNLCESDSTYNVFRIAGITLTDADYNLYHGTDYVGYSGSAMTLSQWRTSTSDEANSLDSDPLLNADGSLTSSSPAVNAGTTAGMVGLSGTVTDAFGNEDTFDATYHHNIGGDFTRWNVPTLLAGNVLAGSFLPETEEVAATPTFIGGESITFIGGETFAWQ